MCDHIIIFGERKKTSFHIVIEFSYLHGPGAKSGDDATQATGCVTSLKCYLGTHTHSY